MEPLPIGVGADEKLPSCNWPEFIFIFPLTSSFWEGAVVPIPTLPVFVITNFGDPEAEATKIFWSPVSLKTAKALPVILPVTSNLKGVEVAPTLSLPSTAKLSLLVIRTVPLAADKFKSPLMDCKPDVPTNRPEEK